MRVRFLIPLNPDAALNPPFTTNPGLVTPPVVNTRIPFVRGLNADVNGNDIQVLLTNCEYAQAIYTKRVPNPDLWEPQLRSAVIAALAAYLVNPIARDANLLKERVQVAVGILEQARVADANEGATSVDHTPDWMDVRYIGGGWWGGIDGVGGYGYAWQNLYDSWASPLGISY
jgi:hypothetical protein